VSVSVRIYDGALRGWSALAGRPVFRRVNTFLMNMGLRGLGVGNAFNSKGEARMLELLSPRWRRAGRGSVLIDVGANEGNYAGELLRLCPDARVFAFEPHPLTAGRLTARWGNRLEVIAKGVGENPGKAILWDHAGRTGSEHASLVPGLIERMYAGSSEGFDVEITSLDQFCEERRITRIDLLKLDVEGHEASCLRGARRLVEAGGIRLIQFEFNILHVASRTFFDDFAVLLPGFRFYRILPHGCLELRLDRVFRCHLYDIQNILAVSPKAYAEEPGLWRWPPA
jgi:FkbM family methyltransferase